jgi:rhomboid protease GluP
MLKFSPRYMLTYALIAVNIAVYAYTAFLSHDLTAISGEVLEQYGQSNSLVIEHGWYWQLFTAMFVHVNIVHIAGNMLFLLIFGLRAEEMFRPHEYLLIYVLSGFAGNVLTLLLPLNYLSAGASGAIFGLFGAVIIYARRAFNQPIVGALIYAFVLLMLSVGLNVNVFAHFGGLAVGLLMGYALAAARPSRRAVQHSYSYST